jgi:hypothetical protein
MKRHATWVRWAPERQGKAGKGEQGVRSVAVACPRRGEGDRTRRTFQRMKRQVRGRAAGTRGAAACCQKIVMKEFDRRKGRAYIPLPRSEMGQPLSCRRLFDETCSLTLLVYLEGCVGGGFVLFWWHGTWKRAHSRREVDWVFLV